MTVCIKMTNVRGNIRAMTKVSNYQIYQRTVTTVLGFLFVQVVCWLFILELAMADSALMVVLMQTLIVY